MKKTTIKDIALKLGVSTSTVSRALSNHPDISDQLKDKITETAKLLHYRPSTAALHLKRGTNKMVAFILPQITSFFYPSVIHGIEQVLHKQGYTLMILPSEDSLHRELENIDIAYDNDVAGVILAVSKETVDTAHLAPLHTASIPIIMIDKVIDDPSIASITIDDFKVAYQMVQYLYKTGCRKIAGIFGKSTLSITHQRYKGFAQACKDLYLEIVSDHVYFVNNTHEAYNSIPQIYKNVAPDGLFVMTDEILIGTMPALIQYGIKIPDQTSVIAISDGYIPNYMMPQTSHMKHDGFELGNLAAQKIIQIINAKNHDINYIKNEKIIMNTNLVLMNSTK